MDLKRAWRNGFLVTVIFAIPLSDLYFHKFSNHIVHNSTKDARVEHSGSCGTDTSCTASPNDNRDEISDVPSSWDNTSDDKSLTIPGHTLAELLFESGGTNFNDIQQTAFQFDPQDIFPSERIGNFDLDTFGSAWQHSDDHFGHPIAPGFGGSFAPAMFGSGGKKGFARSQNASGDDSESPFVDPVHNSLTQSETDSPIDAAPDIAASGMGDESFHNVPETSSFVLVMLGTISVAMLLYRKSKASSPLR
jgi:hypothetical protein